MQREVVGMTGARAILRKARPILEVALRWFITHSATRSLLNFVYLRLGSHGMAAVYRRTAKLFRDRSVRMRPGRWRIAFARRVVVLPLHSERMWLDWDQAVSILGHEPAVKETYRALLEHERPELFVDVGANYGTHSLLFLAAGVRTLTFEPNDSCHPYFLEACRLNKVHPRLEPVALGDAPGEVELYFPPDQTWLGTTEPRVIERLRREGRVESRRVKVRLLDEYADDFAGARTLLKLDAEGHELAILRGADRVLRRHRPTVIFEALRDGDRAALADLFDRFDYRLARLPLVSRPQAVSRAEYLTAEASDFAAIPAERLASR